MSSALLLNITGLGKTVLVIVAGTFIAWAIVTAILIPRRNPLFPRDLNLYITLTAVLFVAQMGSVWWVTGTQEVEEAEAAEVETVTTGGEATETEGGETTTAATTETSTETGSTETETGTETETEATETEVTETETTAVAGDPVAGKEVFASAGCGACHALADAGSNGAIGPNLDESMPSYDLVVDRVTNGRGAMPPFADQLSEEQIADVAAYVVSATES